MSALRKLANSHTAPELAKAIRIEAKYFDTNRERMRYPSFRTLNLFVGSGVIDRFPAQTIWYVLDGEGRQRDRRPPLLLRQRQIRSLLGGQGRLIGYFHVEHSIDESMCS